MLIRISKVFLVLPLAGNLVLAQSQSDQTPDNLPPKKSDNSTAEPLPRFGVAAKASSLGFGFDVGTAVTRRSNVRIGLNLFGFSRSVDSDGIHYDGTLTLRSVDAFFDWQLVGPLHISPGVLLYNGNHADANPTVPGGGSFSLNGNTFFSSASDPVRGTATLDFNKAAPAIMIGFGNLLPRNNHHFTTNLEFGVVFQGSPDTKLNLTGSTCTSTGANCISIASNPIIQSQIQLEQNKINHNLNWFQYYPVVSLSLGWKK